MEIGVATERAERRGRSDEVLVALAIRERGGREAGEWAGDAVGRPFRAVPGEAFSEASEGLAQDPLLVLSQPTQRLTSRLARGLSCPLGPPASRAAARAADG